MPFVHRVGRDFGQHFAELFRLLHLPFFGQALAYAVERVGKAALLHRLHQVIDRLRLESADRMVAISGHEDEERRFDLHHALDDGKAVKSRHLNIKEHKIGFMRLYGANGFAAIGAGFDDFNILMRFQTKLEALNSQAFVVDEDRSDGHAATFDGSSRLSGISMMTEKPPGVERVSKLCRSPKA